MSQITYQHVNFTYPQAAQPALYDISLNVPTGSFSVLCGPSGSGKSTLLRSLKPELCPVGTLSGARTVFEHSIDSLTPTESATYIGYVMQNPTSQIVTDSVWHELAFGLENLGIPTQEMRRRVAETAQYFGIQSWFNKKTSELSGGQKQTLNLAAVMVMQPKILVLDEPTSQLDPIAAKEFIGLLQRINSELGCTILIAEHRLDDVLPLCDNVLFLRNTQLDFQGTAQEFARFVYREAYDYRHYLPVATRMSFMAHDRSGKMHRNTSGALVRYAFTINEARRNIETLATDTSLTRELDFKQKDEKAAEINFSSPVALEAKELWFRYKKESDLVLSGLSLKVHKSSIHAIVGGNASGKTTLLHLLAGGLKPLRGSVRLDKNETRGLLSQNPQTMFVRDSVLDDLLEVAGEDDAGRARAMEQLSSFGIEHLATRHPYDLSGGELQKAALAKLMLVDPGIIFLDEPTKGLDARDKQDIGKLLQSLKSLGKAIVIVSHDLDFVAQFSDQCSLIFNGAVTSSAPSHSFFENNTFYTTNAYRATRGLLEHCVTFDDYMNYIKILDKHEGKIER